MEYITIVGLEIHVQLNTKSKAFSSAPNTYGYEENTKVTINDFGFPGTLPLLNKQVVIDAIQVCHALHMDIDDELWFERKNYFYSDLSKGYQITQEKRPIGTNGYLDIEGKRYSIQRLHIEEDTAKQTHDKRYTYLNMNRSGVPLIEIVTDPIFYSGHDAMMFVKKIKSIVTSLGVSNGRLEEGSMRCDVNVSVQPKDLRYYGNKVEIKNLNTFNNIENAIDYETERQLEIIKTRGIVEQETRRFDEQKQVTITMRKKVDEVDYRYFTDPNILPYKLTKEFVKHAIDSSRELEDDRIERYISLGINKKEATQIAADEELYTYFDEMLQNNCNPKLAANWLVNEVNNYLSKQNLNFAKLNVDSKSLSELLFLVETNKVSNKQARDMFARMIEKGETSSESFHALGLDNQANESSIDEAIELVLTNNKQSIDDYLNGKERAIGYLVGLVIKALNGKCVPSQIKEKVINKIKGE